MKVHKEIKFIWTEEHFERSMGRKPENVMELSLWADDLVQLLAGSMIDEIDLYEDVKEQFDSC